MNLIRASIRGLTRLPKEVRGPFPSKYNVKEVESAWYEWWEDSRLFVPHDHGKSPKAYSTLLPPPNVTGNLHLGHALTVTIQDALARWHRMKGHPVSWIPGSDHAGIATQVVVEKHLLATQGKSRRDYDREDFIQEIQSWKTEKGGTILGQLRSLGASLDWSKEYFTLDKQRSAAVAEAFFRLHDKGLIYRGNFLVNLSCSLSSTISDIEVDWMDLSGGTRVSVPGYEKPVVFGVLYDVAYKLVDGGSEEIVVSTTRPETIPGDVAVAVHPKDPRYSKYIGSRLHHPLCPEKTLPIIADEYVTPEFGTGALKITPGHDSNDYDIGTRHELPIISILDDRGRLVCPWDSDIHDLPRFTAREVIVQKLEASGHLRGMSSSHSMKLPKCSRSGDVVEKVLKPQWFVRTRDMYEKARGLVKDSTLDIKPDHFKKIWERWLSNEKDWCISRQLWWGHRIPMWLCDYSDGSQEWVPGNSEDEVRHKVDARRLVSCVQDPDVLDTWFSSALLPLSSLGWPNNNVSHLREHYPLSLMETGHDIIFFWVARMVMLCSELEKEPPFNKVLLHGLICDAQGRKMSKSLGNVVDPIHIINGISLPEMISNIESGVNSTHISRSEADKAIKGLKKDFPKGIPLIGTDGLRFGLLSYDVQADMINLDLSLIQSSGAFCNKLWQMTRFLMLALDKRSPDEDSVNSGADGALEIEDEWILSCTGDAVQTVNAALESTKFILATRALRTFLYGQVCDVYLEIIKKILSDPSHPKFDTKVKVLEKVIMTGMSLIHPICPFISEEIYQRLKSKTEPQDSSTTSLMTQPYPLPKDWDHHRNDALAARMSHVLSIAASLRNLRLLNKLSNKERPRAILLSEDHIALQDFKGIIQALGSTGDLTICTPNSQDSCETWSRASIQSTGDVVLLECTLDLDKELKGIQNRMRILLENQEKYNSQIKEGRRVKKSKEKLEVIAVEMKDLRAQEAQLIHDIQQTNNL